MEEYIKILEEIVEIYRSCSVNEEGFDMRVDMRFTKKECEALENLIAGYKQLEEENKSKQKAYDDCYCEYKHYKQMEEDIKIIEELINASKVYHQYEGNKYYKAIENLIARYKELKQENEQLKSELGYTGNHIPIID